MRHNFIKDDLANLKLDVDRLVTIPTGLSKPSHLVKNDVVKKDIDDTKTKYITNLATNTTPNAKINEV